MARRKTPLEGDGPTMRFAVRLREARERSGLTLRRLAEISGYSHSTLSIAESGRRLPTWEVAAAFVQACGSQDLERWRGWWDAAFEHEAAQPAPVPDATASAGPEPVTGFPPSPASDPAGTDDPLGPASSASAVPDAPVAPASQRPGRGGPRWWHLLVASVASSLLTATGFLLFPVLFPGHSPVRGPATVVQPPANQSGPTFPPGPDPTPVAACGGATPGYGCHKKDPDASGCWKTAQLAAASTFSYKGKAVGKLENWYSAECGTNWAALRMPKGWRGRVEIVTKTTRDCYPLDCVSFYDKTPPLWSNMLFGMNRSTTALGYVRFPNGETKEFEAATPGP
ncbi:helix-turn-helix domain-containing protein [Streptosporangium sp. NPDC020072]|uniref:helix-turn-helix domain-containing protein n=1 Tax=Streptosporangium sp. NPDC020072 TaxID=3154788 RepID=UPI003427E1CC